MAKAFDKQYAEEKCLWGLSPDQALVESIGEIRVGKALDLGVGEGRNALYLAHKGFQVTGIDLSPEAISKFLDLAEERGLTVEGLAMDIRDFEFKPGVYNLVIAAATLHFLRRSDVYDVIAKVTRTIAFGGYVYIADFTVDDPGYQFAKEKLKRIEENTFYSPRLSSYVHFFRHNELKEAFEGFQVKAYKEEIITDPGHGKTGPHKHGMVLLLAQKKRG